MTNNTSTKESALNFWLAIVLFALVIPALCVTSYLLAADVGEVIQPTAAP